MTSSLFDRTAAFAPLAAETTKGRQLYERLDALLADLKPGDLLPSERALAAQFGVARMTVRQQIDEFARAGRITRVMGKGTLVSETRLPIMRSLPSFSRDIIEMGMRPGVARVATTVLEADEVIAEILDIEPGRPVVQLDRVRTADDLPLSIERTYFSLDRFPGLDQAPFESVSVRAHLSEVYGCVAVRADRRFTIVELSSEDAVQLDVPPGSPAFLAEVTAYDAEDLVVEAGNSLLRADRYEIRMTVDTRH
ncbi:MAG: GntR family transcriptional regulator [Propionibacteriaceae bacterium]|nr:GntR family transcriptional regulator [Propionibacteriaceae bacterium]